MFTSTTSSRCRIVVLISGNGSNLQAIIDAVGSGKISGAVTGVVSNVPDAYGLTRARQRDLPSSVVDHRDYSNRSDFDDALLHRVNTYRPDLVVLAGFMRILPASFVHQFENRMMNIHPSLLPRYRGLDTHRRVLESGDDEHGATVHMVVPELDAGPTVVQGIVRVVHGDDEDSLAQRVHRVEHQIYPSAVEWFAAGRLTFTNGKVLLDGKPAPAVRMSFPG